MTWPTVAAATVAAVTVAVTAFRVIDFVEHHVWPTFTAALTGFVWAAMIAVVVFGVGVVGLLLHDRRQHTHSSRRLSHYELDIDVPDDGPPKMQHTTARPIDQRRRVQLEERTSR